MFHLFHKYGSLDIHNIQYCLVCGKARVLVIPCNHSWKQEFYAEISDHFCGPKEHKKVYRCEKCGEISSVSTHD